MIYLIGGPPRCGKTTIAKKLSKDLGISWLSADTLESVASLYVPKKDRATHFPKQKVRKNTKQSNDVMYNKYSADEIAKLYIKQSKISFPAIKIVAEISLIEGHDYIIEGHQIHPKLIREIITKFGKGNIKALVMTRFDTKEIVEGCKKYKAKNDWFMQKTKNKETYNKIANMIGEYSEYFKTEAQKHKIKIVNMDNDFKKQIKNTTDYLKKYE